MADRLHPFVIHSSSPYPSAPSIVELDSSDLDVDGDFGANFDGNFDANFDGNFDGDFDVGDFDPLNSVEIDGDFDYIFQYDQEPQTMSPVLRSNSQRSPEEETAPGPPPEFGEAILACFPDICREYIAKLGDLHQWSSESAIIFVLDELENNRPYPKLMPSSKRKRPSQEEENEEEQARRKFEGQRHIGKDRHYIRSYHKAAKSLLKSSYPLIYSQDIERLLDDHHGRLYPTFLALSKLSADQAANQGVRFKKRAVKGPSTVDDLSKSSLEADQEAVQEFLAASAICEAKAAKEAEERRKQVEEVANFERAKAEGTLTDCGCCFDEQPRNRMVHCNSDAPHWFCRDCARRMAENQIGLSKYHLGCMSMDGCDAVFDKEQKDVFLDDKLVAVLERIEQETFLRMAGIENLETCPFCPYAAECPPVEEDKEFRCANPECELVSCRYCRQETHIPKTCEEAAREIGHSARRKIEEAMSAALIRKCNKCGTPFIKENGCNKMTCTRPGCYNVQCYVCSKSCDYSHFDDSSRGGKKGNCPLFDNVEERHGEEVQAAEANARKQVAQENPDIDAEALQFNFSEDVKKDEERRKGAHPPAIYRPAVRPPPPPPPPIAHPPLEPDAARQVAQGMLADLQVRGLVPARLGREAREVMARIEQDYQNIGQEFPQAEAEGLPVRQQARRPPKTSSPAKELAARQERERIRARVVQELVRAAPGAQAAAAPQPPPPGVPEPQEARVHPPQQTQQQPQPQLQNPELERGKLAGTHWTQNARSLIKQGTVGFEEALLKLKNQSAEARQGPQKYQPGPVPYPLAAAWQPGPVGSMRCGTAVAAKGAALLQKKAAPDQNPPPPPVPPQFQPEVEVIDWTGLGLFDRPQKRENEPLYYQQDAPQFALPVLARGLPAAGNNAQGQERQVAGEQQQQQQRPKQPTEVIDLTGDSAPAVPGSAEHGNPVIRGGHPVNGNVPPQQYGQGWSGHGMGVVFGAGGLGFGAAFGQQLPPQPQVQVQVQQQGLQELQGLHGMQFPEVFEY